MNQPWIYIYSPSWSPLPPPDPSRSSQCTRSEHLSHAVFPLLLFSSISLHWSLRKASLSLLAILWNSSFKWVYLSYSPLPLTSLLLSAICKASSDDHFAFLHFFFFGMVLITAFSTVSWTSLRSSSSTLSDLISWIYLSFPLYNHKGFDLSHTWVGSGFPYFLI